MARDKEIPDGSHRELRPGRCRCGWRVLPGAPMADHLALYARWAADPEGWRPAQAVKAPAPTDPPNDPVDRPAHYTSHPSGLECIQVTEHMGFNLGNAVKYVWRADLKGKSIEDLRKAVWYIQREIAKREKSAG